MVILFSLIFFAARYAASAAYLTVSEIFRLEIRAFPIAILYAAGTLISGVGAPVLLGDLINTSSRPAVAGAYALGAGFMIAAAFSEYFLVWRQQAKGSSLYQNVFRAAADPVAVGS
jgi:hypothetical protein